jgi:uncharacterized protein (TIGR03067 family)
MRTFLVLALAAALAAGCAFAPTSAPDPAPASGSAAAPAAVAPLSGLAPDPELSGTWVPVLAELGGKEFKFGQEFRLVVKGDRYEVSGASQKDIGRLVFAGGDPKGFDVVGEEGPSKGKRYPVIYRFLPDGRLETCYDLEGVGRPAAFTTFEGTQLFRVIYKRG